MKHTSLLPQIVVCTLITLCSSLFVVSPGLSEGEAKCRVTPLMTERVRFVTQKKVKGFTCRDGLLHFVKEIPAGSQLITINTFVVSPLYAFVPVQLRDGSTVLVKVSDLR